MKRITILFAAAAVTLAGCGQPAGTYAPQPQQVAYVDQDEVEDCDFDDMLERDDDCGFSKSKKHKVKATKTKRTIYSTPARKSSRSSWGSSSRSSRRR